VILSPEQSMEDEQRTMAFVEEAIKQHGTPGRTYKSALIFIACGSPATLKEEARRLLAWEEIERELPEISADESQVSQLRDSIKKARRDLRESVWRSYNAVALLGKDNSVRTIDLGKATSSAAATIIQYILSELIQVDEVQKGISAGLLVRNWPPALPEWNTKAVRDAFYASPLFPRLLDPEAIRETIARGVSNNQIAYVGKASNGKYLPFTYERQLTAPDVEISEEMYIIRKETADAYRQALSHPAPTPPQGGSLFPGDEAAGPAPGTPPQQPTPPKPATTSASGGAAATPKPEQLLLELKWSGEVPSQKWMNFYTKFLTKLGVGADLSLKVSVKCKPQTGLSQQKVDEVKSVLRELGLNDDLGE